MKQDAGQYADKPALRGGLVGISRGMDQADVESCSVEPATTASSTVLLDSPE